MEQLSAISFQPTSFSSWPWVFQGVELDGGYRQLNGVKTGLAKS